MKIQDAKQARPHCELIAELLDSRRPKTEREHAAAREIERLRDVCDDLYSDLLAAGSLAMTETQKQVVKWLATGRVGMSSKCMAMWLAFGEHTEDRFCPADPGDLDRCLKLLDKAPGLRPLIPKMAEVSKDWAALVPRWDEVEASHLAEVGLGWTKARSAPKTYELMASILRPERVRA